MIAIIFDGDHEINRIVADEAFAAAYCAEKGYTYEMRPEPEPPPEPSPEPPASLEARVETLETETAAISAAIERGLRL